MKLFPIFRKHYFLTNETHKNLHNVIEKMDKKTIFTISKNGNAFSAQYVTGGILKENNNALFSQLSKQSSIVVFNNKRYIINNTTGEIKPENKSILDAIIGIPQKTIKGIGETINKIKDNFENPKVVKQHKWGIDSFTKKGVEILKEAQRKVLAGLKMEK